MKLNNYIYIMSLIFSLISILSIYFAYINDDKNTNKFILKFNILCIIYMFVISVVLHNVIGINVGIGILLIWMIEVVAGIFYIISCINCISKVWDKKTNPKFNYIRTVIWIILIVPIIAFIIPYSYEYGALSKGNVVVSLTSRGNGGFGDSEDFYYVINDKGYKEISLSVDYNGDTEKYNYKKLDINEIDPNGYRAEVNKVGSDNYLVIYKDNKQISNIKLAEKYFNIEINYIFTK